MLVYDLYNGEDGWIDVVDVVETKGTFFKSMFYPSSTKEKKMGRNGNKLDIAPSAYSQVRHGKGQLYYTAPPPPLTFGEYDLTVSFFGDDEGSDDGWLGK
ncbi:hypothetical protein L249_0443 [Ophiocordyceps polyrhachis-furcata BCC 54312]|uniref:Uncharacterized protein n=1 Tax=Ophiocordyceps polyrhachis-furcata BCC 54312 TaxID=1330021 RepID=A0A367LFH4_9HYPO|nr:hypothetical protein L249_0443 [Ophiocordyceps polyrhachis-furcata BCC 54312]